MFDRLNLRAGAAALALGVAALVWAAMRPVPSYYRYVDEVVAEAPKLLAQRTHIQVHGCVVPGSIRRRAGTDEYRFLMRSIPPRAPAGLEVHYTGWVPDAFRGNTEIVAEGRLAGWGWLDVVPDGVLVKCPGKYDPEFPPDWQCHEPGP